MTVSESDHPSGYDVVIAGGGVIGLSIAWRAAEAGHRVCVVDAGETGAASWAAAGMLTPVTEAYWGEDDLLALTRDSMARWPEFGAALEDRTGHDIGLELHGVLAVGFDADDRAVVDDLHGLHQRHDLVAERVRGRALRSLEPLLGAGMRSGVWAPGDGAVDPRRVTAALSRAVIDLGGHIVSARVIAPTHVGARVIGVDTTIGPIEGDTTVVCLGAWSGPWGRAVRPVVGEVIRMRPHRFGHAPQRVIRAVVRGRHVYVVPRRCGEIVVGATSRDVGFDPTVTVGGVHDLLRDALAVVPALSEAEITESVAGFRPGTPDNAPIIGPSEHDGLLWATGHYRNGVLLAPITADAVVEALAGRPLPDSVSVAARPDRSRVLAASARPVVAP